MPRERNKEPSGMARRLPSPIELGFSPFHTAALDYLKAGFLPFPLPIGKKYPPPKGVPNEIEIDESKVAEWLDDERASNIGTIVPDGLLVIDVDGVAGQETLQELENEFGPLPPTWVTFRGDPDRYHLWYSTPAGMTWPGKLGAGLDLIHRHYRYMVAPPSVHPNGEQYRWANLRDKQLAVANMYLPNPDETNDLPEEWFALSNGHGYKRRDRAQVDSRLWLSEYGEGEPCPEMRRAVIRHQRELRKHAEPGGLHDAMVNGVWAIMAEVSAGHSGGHAALKRFKSTFVKQRGESGRRLEDVKGEWERACIGAIEKTAIERVRDGDPCTIEEAERGRNPDRFFDPKHGLRARKLRESVELTGRLAVGPGKLIYRHHSGLWTPDGESEIYRRTELLLGERYRPSHAANVKSVVENREPLISDDNQDVKHLNLPNGLLDWEEGRLYPHNPNVISTARIPIEWEEDAECPEIDKWLREVFPDDAYELAIEILGYMLYNDNPLHKAILLYGSGRNGKGTFIRLARMLVGHSNISAVTPQALDSSQFSSAQLYGKLANLVGDVDPRIFKSTEQFKQLTGGDYMMAQHKHKDPFTFRCRALMIAAFNALPRTADTTEGFFSRWVVVPFERFFPAGKADTGVIGRLTARSELRGLLRLAVGGLQNVMRRGAFTIPDSVRRATERFRAEADPIRGFIEERLESTSPNSNTLLPRTDVYAEYVVWSQMNGFHQMSAIRFYEQLMMAATDILPFPPRLIRKSDGRYYQGIEIRK